MQRRLVAFAGLIVVTATAVAVSAEPPPGEASFLAENQRTMKTMMTAMAVAPTGDVDRDFLAMMIPHHQGAIAMAMSELRYGHDRRLRRIAQDIVVNQRQQVVSMRKIYGELSAEAAPNQPRPGAHRMIMPMAGLGAGR